MALRPIRESDPLGDVKEPQSGPQDVYERYGQDYDRYRREHVQYLKEQVKYLQARIRETLAN